jgi:hypothetical protein
MCHTERGKFFSPHSFFYFFSPPAHSPRPRRPFTKEIVWEAAFRLGRRMARGASIFMISDHERERERGRQRHSDTMRRG